MTYPENESRGKGLYSEEKNERVSVIIPVYNAENFIKTTIESVRRQTFEDWELFLVDDCSKDRTKEIIEEYVSLDKRIHYIPMEENKGAWAARNKGLEVSGGRYVAFLDSDDVWKEEKLEKELAYMTQKGAGFVFTSYEFADENSVGTGRVVRVPEELTLKQAYHNTIIFTSTVLLDREKIAEKLMYMPNMRSEDTATWWTIMKAGHKAVGLNENLVLYRRSQGTLSSNKVKALKRIWVLLREIGGLNIFQSAWHFMLWAFLAVKRRI